MRMIFRCVIGLCLLLMQAGCVARIAGTTSYYDSGKTPTRGQLRVLVLDNGVVEEFPRTRFDTVFQSNKGFSQDLGEFLAQNLGNTTRHVVTDRDQIKGFKKNVQHFFAKSEETVTLPDSWLDGDGPTLVVTDWEYKVSSHTSFTGAHQVPGGSTVLRTADYGYYRIVLYGFVMDRSGKVRRYVSAEASQKYSQGVKRLPLQSLMRSAARRFARALSKGETAAHEQDWPRNFYRQ